MASETEDNCFVCSKTGSNLNIFTTYNICNDKEELYVDVIKNCYSIEIGQDSGLNAMCTDCSIKLTRAYTFKTDIIEAVNKLVVLQDAVAEETELSNIEYLNQTFENEYDIKKVLNPETGQVIYTLDKITENKETANEQVTYLIDLENDFVITKEEDNKKVRKYKRKNKTDVVKENLPDNLENKKKKPNKTKSKKKDTVPVVNGNKNAIDCNVEEVKKTCKKIITIDGDLVNAPDDIDNSCGDLENAPADIENAAGDVENAPSDVENGPGDVENAPIQFEIVVFKSELNDTEAAEKEEKSSKKPKKANNVSAKTPLYTIEPDQTKCSLCCTEFETNKALREHMNVHYPDFSCDCGMAFTSMQRLRNHVNQTHNVEESLNCKYCEKSFTNVNTRNAHMWRVHTKADPFKCPQCGERFKTYLRRLRHVQSVHGDTVEYPCQYCDKKFAYAAYRTKHIRTVHLEERPYKCMDCLYSFARHRELAAHRASKHGDGELKYQCPVCDKKFFFKTALKWHVNQHNRHKCNQCDAKFSDAAALEDHAKSHEFLDQSLDHLPSLDPVLHLDEFTDYALDSSFWIL